MKNLELSEKFYTSVLQLRKIERPPFPSAGVWFAIGESGQQLHLMEGSAEGTSEGNGNSGPTQRGHFAIWVESYTETIAWLDHCQVTYDSRPNSVAGFAQIYIRDLDQHIIELASAYENV